MSAPPAPLTHRAPQAHQELDFGCSSGLDSESSLLHPPAQCLAALLAKATPALKADCCTHISPSSAPSTLPTVPTPHHQHMQHHAATCCTSATNCIILHAVSAPPRPCALPSHSCQLTWVRGSAIRGLITNPWLCNPRIHATSPPVAPLPLSSHPNAFAAPALLSALPSGSAAGTEALSHAPCPITLPPLHRQHCLPLRLSLQHTIPCPMPPALLSAPPSDLAAGIQRPPQVAPPAVLSTPSSGIAASALLMLPHRCPRQHIAFHICIYIHTRYAFAPFFLLLRSHLVRPRFPHFSVSSTLGVLLIRQSTAMNI